MNKNRKGFRFIGLIVLCLLLAGGFFLLNQRSESGNSTLILNDNPDVVPTDSTSPVVLNIPAINPSEKPTETMAAKVNPSEIATEDSTDTRHDISLTTISDKPDAPELPTDGQTDTATLNDVADYEALDPALKNPDVKPDIVPETTPPKPQEITPQAGDKNGNGEIYIPGFGWVKDEGGGGEGQPSGSDGDWNKIIGY